MTIPLLLALAVTMLPQHVVLNATAPVVPARSISFANLRTPVRALVTARSVTFAIPLAAAEIGGIPRGLRARVTLFVPLSAGAHTLVELRFNGALIGARELTQPGSAETLSVAVPAAFVGATNGLLVTVGSPAATLAATSAFGWDGLRDVPETVADFLKLAHGRGLVLLDPAFAPAAANILRAIGAMNSSLADVDVRRFAGTVPSGYDEVLVFAKPRDLAAHFELPLRGGDAPFRIVNPLNDVELVGTAESANAATMQVGRAAGAPLLAFSYVDDPRAVDRLAHLSVADLQVQVGNIALATDAGVTAYEVGSKLRIVYAEDGRLLRGWNAIRFPLALVLLAAIVAGGLAASRRLAQKPRVAA